MKAKIYIIALVLFFPVCLLSQESNAILCSDGIDNDGDGQIDCEDEECLVFSNNGCSVCTDGLSFADSLIEYIPGCPLADPDPEGALGVSDWTGVGIDEPQFVFLGEGGSIKLGFTNNLLTNSGNAQEDLWVFEIGPAVESSDLALRPANTFTESQLLLYTTDNNSDGFYEIGNISGSASGFDIDAILPGYAPGELVFDAIEIKDVIDGNCVGGTPGADIDAVCALSFLVIDCAGVTNGEAAIDECGECLEPDDPSFNQSCIDCAGVTNGEAVIDECGECLNSNDPNFNQSCADCAGVINGEAVIDECGECFVPNDPSFNQSCMDCAGVLNGTAVIDKCGTCLSESDPNFDQSCGIFIPNVFSPNDDGVNDRFQLYAKSSTLAKVHLYRIFSRWGELIYESNDFEFSDTLKWWNGKFEGKEMHPGVYVYYVEVLFINGEVETYKGDVTVVK